MRIDKTEKFAAFSFVMALALGLFVAAWAVKFG